MQQVMETGGLHWELQHQEVCALLFACLSNLEFFRLGYLALNVIKTETAVAMSWKAIQWIVSSNPKGVGRSTYLASLTLCEFDEHLEMEGQLDLQVRKGVL